MQNILNTERLLLREFTLEDAPFILTLVNTPSWLEFIGDRNIHSIENAKAYLISGPMASYKTNGYGLSAIVLKEDNTLLGMCGLVNRDNTDYVDIGFALLPEFVGKGYAYEISSSTMAYAKNILGIEKVVATTNANNTSSIKLLNKLGLQFDKTVSLSVNDSALLFSPVVSTDSQAEIDALSDHFFRLFTNTNDVIPRVSEIKNLFIPEGMIISNTGDNYTVYNLDSFIIPRELMLTDGTLTNFSEREISSKTKIYGNIAQRFCLYEKSGSLNDQPFETRGMKAIQFVKVNQKWLISSVAWSDEIN
jgi:RimJ/RimL family protein N-acetyltransferase